MFKLWEWVKIKIMKLKLKNKVSLDINPKKIKLFYNDEGYIIRVFACMVTIKGVIPITGLVIGDFDNNNLISIIDFETGFYELIIK